MNDISVKLKTFKKVCLYCHTHFEHVSRNTRFCPDQSKNCQKKYQASSRRRKKEYKEKQDMYRIKIQAHTLAVMVLDNEVREARIEKKCLVCATLENLECHHRNMNWLDNRPQNLSWLCVKHHPEEHSKFSKGEPTSHIVAEDDGSTPVPPEL